MQSRGRGRARGGRSSGGGSSRSPPPPAFQAAAISSPPIPISSLSNELERRLSLQARSPPTKPPIPEKKPRAPPKFAPRPGYGAAGTRTLIRANHFLVELEDRDLHHYDVSITPEVTSRGLNRAVMRELLELHGKTHFAGRKPAYDGRKGFYTAGELPFTSKDFVVKLIEKDDTGSKRKEREFKVIIKFTTKLYLRNLREFLHGRQRDAPHEIIQVLDVVLRESPSNNCTVVGRSFFSSDWGERIGIGNGVECWKGFYQTLRPTQMGMSLNMDVYATAFYEPIPVIDYVVNFLNLRNPSTAALRPLSENDRNKLKKVLRGVKVEVTHREAKRYKVSGLTSLPTDQLMFPADGGKEKSVIQYFQERYNIRLLYGSWPSLQSGSESKPIYLPMERCVIVEGQRYAKKLNEKQVTALLRQACKRPGEREETIKGIAANNNYQNDTLAREFGINVKNELTSIDARVLPPPILKYNDSGKDRTIKPRMGQWNMINAKMLKGAQVKFWLCVNFSSLKEDIASAFCKDLVGMCRNKGMAITPMPLFPIQSRCPNAIEKALSEIHRACGTEGKPLDLMIIILPDVSGSYGRIKRVCDTELGIVSQCCQPKHAKKYSPQYLENVALKINVKTGGKNNVLNDALNRKIPLLSDIPTIIFGADVTHPPPGEDSSPSIAAVVASMDWPDVTLYRGLVSAQQHREEIIQDLYNLKQDSQGRSEHVGMVRELLRAFFKETKRKPERIIFFRDGVSEGQFNDILLYEMDAIRQACASLQEGYLPPVTFVVVQKRHHTRLFPSVPTQTDRSGNILPGTVVDTKICHPREYDFYLCSHAGIQGTSRPVHYHVLFDENGFSPDALQTLTNNLCYTYARCTRSVSVVPPAYYAHLAAFRARYYIDGDIVSDGEYGTGLAGVRREAAPIRPLPAINPKVKDFMFYC